MPTDDKDSPVLCPRPLLLDLLIDLPLIRHLIGKALGQVHDIVALGAIALIEPLAHLAPRVPAVHVVVECPAVGDNEQLELRGWRWCGTFPHPNDQSIWFLVGVTSLLDWAMTRATEDMNEVDTWFCVLEGQMFIRPTLVVGALHRHPVLRPHH